MAHLINESLDSNDQELISMLDESGVIPNLEAACPVADISSNSTTICTLGTDVLLAVACTDGGDVTGKGMTYWRWYVD